MDFSFHVSHSISSEYTHDSSSKVRRMLLPFMEASRYLLGPEFSSSPPSEHNYIYIAGPPSSVCLLEVSFNDCTSQNFQEDYFYIFTILLHQQQGPEAINMSSITTNASQTLTAASTNAAKNDVLLGMCQGLLLHLKHQGFGNIQSAPPTFTPEQSGIGFGIRRSGTPSNEVQSMAIKILFAAKHLTRAEDGQANTETAVSERMTHNYRLLQPYFQPLGDPALSSMINVGVLNSLNHSMAYGVLSKLPTVEALAENVWIFGHEDTDKGFFGEKRSPPMTTLFSAHLSKSCVSLDCATRTLVGLLQSRDDTTDLEPAVNDFRTQLANYYMICTLGKGRLGQSSDRDLKNWARDKGTPGHWGSAQP